MLLYAFLKQNSLIFLLHFPFVCASDRFTGEREVTQPRHRWLFIMSFAFISRSFKHSLFISLPLFLSSCFLFPLPAEGLGERVFLVCFAQIAKKRKGFEQCDSKAYSHSGLSSGAADRLSAAKLIRAAVNLLLSFFTQLGILLYQFFVVHLQIAPLQATSCGNGQRKRRL